MRLKRLARFFLALFLIKPALSLAVAADKAEKPDSPAKEGATVAPAEKEGEKKGEAEKKSPAKNRAPVAFSDLEADHWARKAVNDLIHRGFMEGYPDGTFKGRKVLTRYDLALILAKMLQTLDRKEQDGKSLASADAVILARLSKEFKDELGLLGVRTDAFEKRLGSAEESIKKMEKNFPKVVISGFYQGRTTYIFERKSTTEDEDGDGTDDKEYDPGLQDIEHQAFVRFTGKPFDEAVETFVEFLGRNIGKRDKILEYANIGQTLDPDPQDRADDFLSDYINEQKVTINKAHLKVNSKLLNFRYFAGESTTGLDDPHVLITQDTDIFDPYNGVEISGEGGPIHYFLTAMKDFDSDKERYRDVFGGRVRYLLPKKFSPDEISLGTNFAERVNDYTIRNNTNSVRGIDFAFKTSRAGDLTLTSEWLRSLDFHTNSQNKVDEGVRGSGFKIDGTYKKGDFTGTYKHYEYDKDFRARLADPLYIDTARDYKVDPGKQPSTWNYGKKKKDGSAEILTRMSAKYEFKDKIISLAKNLTLELVAQIKDFKEDPFEPDPTDTYTGEKYSLQTYIDWNDTTSSRFLHELKKDAFKDEDGRQKSEVELNLKVTDTLSSKAQAIFVRDPDRLDAGLGYKSRDGFFELSSNISPRLFLQGNARHFSEWPTAPTENNEWTLEGKFNYQLTPNFTWGESIKHSNYDKTFDNTKDKWTNALVSELKANFTKAFKGRALHGRRVVTNKNTPEFTDTENIYGELIYTPTDVTTLELKFGFDYPSAKKFDFGATQKKLFLQAKTDF